MFAVAPLASDTLNISVWKNRELNARVPVAPDGMISLPLVGDVMAAGRTPATEDGCCKTSASC